MTGECQSRIIRFRQCRCAGGGEQVRDPAGALADRPPASQGGGGDHNSPCFASHSSRHTPGGGACPGPSGTPGPLSPVLTPPTRGTRFCQPGLCALPALPDPPVGSVCPPGQTGSPIRIPPDLRGRGARRRRFLSRHARRISPGDSLPRTGRTGGGELCRPWRSAAAPLPCIFVCSFRRRSPDLRACPPSARSRGASPPRDLSL